MPILLNAAECGHARVVKVLLENGADHTLVDNDVCTAAEYREEKNPALFASIASKQGYSARRRRAVSIV